MAMNKLAAALAGITVLAVSSPGLAQSRASNDRPEEQVRTVVLAVPVAVERGDLKALDALYSHDPSVLIIEGGSADVGWKQYRDHHLTPELKAVKNLKYKYSNVAVSVVGEVAWASFDYSLDAVMKGKPLSIKGKGTLVLRKTAGDWKIVHSHTSGRPAGASAAH
jgi:ketosteroid isomerase-like protein